MSGMSAFDHELLSLEHFKSGEGGILTLLNNDFSLATLQDSWTDDSEMERFIRSVIGLDSTLALSSPLF